MSKPRRLLVLLLAVATTTAASPGRAQASTTTQATVYDAMKMYKGVTIYNTHLMKKATIIGFQKITEVKRGTFWVPEIKTSNICVSGQPCAQDYSITVGQKVVSSHVGGKTYNGYTPNWTLNPLKWAWSDIWHWVVLKLKAFAIAFWNDVIRGCVSGAKTGFEGIASVRVAAGILVKYGWVTRATAAASRVGWQGALIAGLGACLLEVHDRVGAP